jgi:methyl-accepting chemotaxis protein
MYKVSIRTKLTSYFLSIVAISSVASVIFIFLHVLIVNKYQRIEDNIFAQYRLIGATSALVADYNVYRSTGNASDLTIYLADKKNIEDIIAGLKVSVTQKDSRSILTGVEKTIASVLSETDQGVVGIQSGDPTGTSERYSEAYRKYSFVQENITNLILKEVGYGQELGVEVARINRLVLIFGGLLFVLVVLVLVWLSFYWARSFITPLTKLTSVAGLIAKGDLEKNVGTDLTERGDEFGSLATSFNVMIGNLRKSMTTLVQSNTAIESKNSELEHLNKFMIDREIKMIELKKRIHELEGKKPEEETSKALVIEKV